MRSRKLSIHVEREAAQAYDFLSAPENFARWASGAAGMKVRFTERNSHGVLDHAVDTPEGATVYVPLRLRPRGTGCELELTLFRLPGVSDEKFAADAEWVMRDLREAKRLLEHP